MIDTNIINLQSLIDLSARLNEFEDDDKIINTALLSLMGKLKYSKSLILIPENNKFKVKKIRADNYFFIERFHSDEIVFISKYKNEKLAEESIDICIPLIVKNDFNYFICFGKRLINSPISDEEFRYIHLVTSITNNALNNAANLRELKKKQTETKRKNQLLKTLLEISKDFNTLLTKEKIFKMLSFHLMGQLAITKFAVYEFTDGKLKLKINKFSFKPEINCVSSIIKADRTLNLENQSICSDIKSKYPDFHYAIPMKQKGETKGILIIGRKMNGDVITGDNLVFLESLANISVAALENVRLLKDEIRKKQLENEMNYARVIQQNFLPKNIISPKNYDISGKSIPSRQVGGDYFDIIKLSETKTLVAVADVSGKGVAASLIMSNLQAALKVSSENFHSLLKIVEILNKQIFTNTEADKFVTLFIGILDIEKNIFEYINAGHNPAVHISEDRYNLMDSTGLILGFDIICDDYEIKEIKIKENDLIFIYTDGVNEAENSEKEDFGTERLLSLLLDNKNLKSAELIDKIITETRKFAGGNEQYDDITMLSIKNLSLS